MGENGRKLCSFGPIRKNFNRQKFPLSMEGSLSTGVSLFLIMATAYTVYRDHGCCLPFARNAVFVQQQLPKPPLRYGSFDQQWLSLCPCIIVGVAACLTHKLSFPIIFESCPCENSTYSNSGKFFTNKKDSCFTVFH